MTERFVQLLISALFGIIAFLIAAVILGAIGVVGWKVFCLVGIARFVNGLDCLLIGTGLAIMVLTRPDKKDKFFIYFIISILFGLLIYFSTCK